MHLPLLSWNFIQWLPIGRGYAILILGQNVQGHDALITKNGDCCIIAKSLYTYHHETSHDSPWVEDVSYWFWVQKVKGHGHNELITENGLCCIIAFPEHLSSWICSSSSSIVQGSYAGALSHTTLKDLKSCGGGL